MIPMPLTQIARAVNGHVEGLVDEVLIQRVSTDSRDIVPGDLFVAIRGERHDGHDHVCEAAGKGAIAALVGSRRWKEVCSKRESPPIPCVIVEDTVGALGRLATNYRCEVMNAATIVVAVTGSNGKTTTKQMIDHVLRPSLKGRASPRSFNNHLGVPLTLLSADWDDRYLVVEVGTNAPGEIAALGAIASPNVVVITSVGEAHLEGLRSVDEIAIEKVSLLDHVRPGGLAVVNIDRPELRRRLRRPTHARLMTYGFELGADHRIEPLSVSLNGTIFSVGGRHRVELCIPGIHHAANATAAVIVGRWFGVLSEELAGRLNQFTALEGRARMIRVGGVTIVDDAYNANPASMAGALETMRLVSGGRRVFVMGDMFELGEQSEGLHRRIVELAERSGLEMLVAVGERTLAAVERLPESSHSMRVVRCADAMAASQTLLASLRPGDCVWIKGSRLMGLDRVVNDLLERFNRRAAVA